MAAALASAWADSAFLAASASLARLSLFMARTIMKMVRAMRRKLTTFWRKLP